MIYKNDYYDVENNCIYDNDINSLKETLDFIYYNPITVKENIKQIFNTYYYEKYFFTVVGGDWGLSDRATYRKIIVKINKNTGKITEEYKEITKFDVDY